MDRRNVTISLISSEQLPKEVALFFADTPDEMCRMNGKLYFPAGEDTLCCRDDEIGTALFAALKRKYDAGEYGSPAVKSVWYRIIHSADPDRIAEAAHQYGIEDRVRRYVILFRLKSPLEKDLSRIFSELASVEENDHPVILSHDMIALIKESELRSEDEITEYAAAVIDTMVSEGYTDLQAGIGREAEDLSGLHRSYEEAREALFTGTRYHAEESLFRYSRQRLERIIDQIPPDSRRKILEDFSSGCRSEAFSDEMMETVRVFFEHDLNIASASKQLFIHRNTLNYRLDKIKRDTGLDLRAFQDAVVFRLIYEMTEDIRYIN